MTTPVIVKPIPIDWDKTWWSSLDPDLMANHSERFYARTQQYANPICRLSRYYDGVPGVVHSDRKFSGTITCESSLFGGAPGTINNWKIGFQNNVELTRISQDYGLSHWELGIGMAPWLVKMPSESRRQPVWSSDR